MRTRPALAAPLALVAALTTAVLPLDAARADTTPADPSPSITGITTENTGGGLSPYLPLFSNVVVFFTDPTPSDAERYRVVVPGVGPVGATADSDDPTHFRSYLPVYGMTAGRSYSFRVEESSADGTVTGTSAPVSFTPRYVGHPQHLGTSSRKVRGQWSYRAGSTARFRFRGAWERGTLISTRVWVSRTRTFTADDWDRNVRHHGALVQRYDAAAPVLAVRIPRRLVGRYVWVSFVGWKPGTAGWQFTVPAEKVVR